MIFINPYAIAVGGKKTTISHLPNEMLVFIFEKLDPISLGCANEVCSRWRGFIDQDDQEKMNTQIARAISKLEAVQEDQLTEKEIISKLAKLYRDMFALLHFNYRVVGKEIAGLPYEQKQQLLKTYAPQITYYHTLLYSKAPYSSKEPLLQALSLYDETQATNPFYLSTDPDTLFKSFSLEQIEEKAFCVLIELSRHIEDQNLWAYLLYQIYKHYAGNDFEMLIEYAKQFKDHAVLLKTFRGLIENRNLPQKYYPQILKFIQELGEEEDTAEDIAKYKVEYQEYLVQFKSGSTKWGGYSVIGQAPMSYEQLRVTIRRSPTQKLLRLKEEFLCQLCINYNGKDFQTLYAYISKLCDTERYKAYGALFKNKRLPSIVYQWMFTEIENLEGQLRNDIAQSSNPKGRGGLVKKVATTPSTGQQALINRYDMSCPFFHDLCMNYPEEYLDYLFERLSEMKEPELVKQSRRGSLCRWGYLGVASRPHLPSRYYPLLFDVIRGLGKQRLTQKTHMVFSLCKNYTGDNFETLVREVKNISTGNSTSIKYSYELEHENNAVLHAMCYGMVLNKYLPAGYYHWILDAMLFDSNEKIESQLSGYYGNKKEELLYQLCLNYNGADFEQLLSQLNQRPSTKAYEGLLENPRCPEEIREQVRELKHKGPSIDLELERRWQTLYLGGHG